MSDKRMTFIEHLGELRRVFVISGLAILIGFFIALAFWKELDWILRWPIRDLFPKGSGLVYLGLFEPLFYMLKLSLIVGIVVASPVVFWQIWWFVAPGLYPKERRLAVPFVAGSSLFFLGGITFGYFVILPLMASFSVSQMAESTQMMMSLDKYRSEALMFLLAFGLVFETPALVFLISWIGLVQPKTLGRYRKYVLLGSFVLAAVITPTTDPLNQTMVAVPMYILYELGILLAKQVRRFKNTEDRKATD